MRRMPLLFGTVISICAGALGAIVACGGDDDASEVPPPPPDGAAASSSGSTTSGATTSSSSSSSGGPTDGGASSSSSSGDLGSNPGQLSCGATVCDAGFSSGGLNVCCQAANETDTKCRLRNDCDNSGSNGDLRLQCDEAADCVGDNAGDICCYLKVNTGQPSFTAFCQARDDCRTFQAGQGQVPRPQLCKTNAECGDAGACNEKTCDGFKLHVCGTPLGCK
jgi:hypothetical protein